MSSLDQDLRDFYTQEGEEIGAAKERERHIKTTIEIALAVRTEDESIDHLLSRLPIPEEDRADVEQGLRERIS